MITHTKQPRLPDIAAKIYDLLEPLDAPTRTKVLQGVLGLLGDPAVSEGSPTPGAANTISGFGPQASSRHVTGAKAQAWMRKHALTDELLERVFDFDGQCELIASPPGTNKREQTINAYVLIGVQHFLQSDDSKFSDAAAVALCKRLGCYDQANHALTRSRFGNRLSGSKDSGYALTVPGLDQAAALVKTIASAGEAKR